MAQVGRPRAFDPEQALRRALDAFWRNGFGATSIADLEKAAGLGRASLYATFGDKEALFLRVLDRYEQLYGSPAFEPLRRADLDMRTAVEAVLERTAARVTEPGSPRGCLVLNVGAESLAAWPHVEARVRAMLEAAEIAFHEAFVKAQTRGELAADEDAQALAHFFAGVIRGIAATARLNPDPRAARDMARLAMRVWPAAS